MLRVQPELRELQLEVGDPGSSAVLRVRAELRELQLELRKLQVGDAGSSAQRRQAQTRAAARGSVVGRLELEVEEVALDGSSSNGRGALAGRRRQEHGLRPGACGEEREDVWGNETRFRSRVGGAQRGWGPRVGFSV